MTNNNEYAVELDGNVNLKLKGLVDKIEHLESEKKEILDEISAIYQEAKGEGFDVKIIRKIISIRKKDKNKMEEEEYLINAYKEALGMKE